jgi:hypothetical protein
MSCCSEVFDETNRQRAGFGVRAYIKRLKTIVADLTLDILMLKDLQRSK